MLRTEDAPEPCFPGGYSQPYGSLGLDVAGGSGNPGIAVAAASDRQL